MRRTRIAASAALLFLAAGTAGGAARRAIPEGRYADPFRTGAGRDSLAPSKDSVTVPAFKLDARAVTTAEYLAFVKKHREWAKSAAGAPFADSLYLSSWRGDFEPPRPGLSAPVTEVSWFAAKAYCEAAGGRLPATAEWERVANAPAPGLDSAGRVKRILDWYARPAGAGPIAAEGSRDAFGVRDFYGRVWEWTSDFNASKPGPGADNAFCGGAGQATARGADYATYMRYSFRSSLRPEYAVSTLGFRCAEASSPSRTASPRRATSHSPSLSDPLRSGTAVSAALAPGSLYRLRSGWEDDAGRRLTLSSFRGKARILTLFFSHCESTCPMVLGTLKGLAGALPKGWETRAGVVMATLDPGRDGAADLAVFRDRMSLSREGYVLLRGGEEDTRELAMALGAAYRKSEANGGVEHEAVIAVLDPEGRVAHRHDGSVDAATLVKELLAAAGG